MPEGDEVVETTTDAGLEAPVDDQGAEGSLSESQESFLFELDGKPITLEEARSGYMRQSDYTRKTQEVAQTRAQLARAEAIHSALEANPEAALRVLGEHYGVNFGQASVVEDNEWGLPADPRLDAVTAKVHSLEQERVQERIDRELTTLHDQFGDFDEAALFDHAIKHGASSLKDAYALMHFDEVAEIATAKQRAAAEEEARVAAKRNASIIETGAGRQPAASATAKPKMYDSVRDAYEAAVQALSS